jgi:soluble lytic murein transglycosylase
MRVEAGFELDQLSPLTSSATDLEQVATALAGGCCQARAARLAIQAARHRAGQPVGRSLAELLYPLPYADVLELEAKGADVDPMLVAAIIRQESLFDPAARSTADARGLMQLLPSVGGQLARRAGLPDWDPVLLYQPDVNLNLGVEHLASTLGRFRWLEQALAAYNAGAGAVARWRSIRGVDRESELFVERIPYVETRDYVRRVIRNLATYRALYRPPTS